MTGSEVGERGGRDRERSARDSNSGLQVICRRTGHKATMFLKF